MYNVNSYDIIDEQYLACYSLYFMCTHLNYKPVQRFYP